MTIDTALRAEVEKWIAEDPDSTTRSQLKEMLDSGDETSLRSCFAGFLEFGTAGLRGPLGPGPSRMNRAVVTKTAAGLAIYMKRNGLKSVVIGRDARYGSEQKSCKAQDLKYLYFLARCRLQYLHMQFAT
ncbi:MAG: hypothetical protein RL155_849 [Actinomycetota bacterium]